ncbi:MAG: hypothetical protein OXE86_09540 [Alphaproteobacteria bacterium]|nr:hypothetical protein [Alphaproteobacteria bacterium]
MSVTRNRSTCNSPSNADHLRADPAFDGALTLATLWDRAKAANGGFRIYATRPRALRNGQGHLTRADGSVILGHGRDGATSASS